MTLDILTHLLDAYLRRVVARQVPDDHHAETPETGFAAMPKRWSQRVTERSNALDLEPGVFALDDPRAIARSLKRSAERSRRRKSEPFRSAMSMLNFYINRAGKQLPAARRRCLEQAKNELRELYGRPGAGAVALRRKSRRVVTLTHTGARKK